MKKAFYFLGSIYLAIPLILISALLVLIGTFIESHTDSHGAAVQSIYGNRLFYTLLSLYFINILFSTLKRYPFKKKHIPFLLTHLALLMVIAGQFIKGVYGLQGVMRLAEGEGTNELLIPGTYTIKITEKKAGRLNNQTKEIPMQIIAPHSSVTWESWIKGDTLDIQGLPAIPLVDQEGLLSARVHFNGKTGPVTSVIASKTLNAKAIEQLPRPSLGFFKEGKTITMIRIDEQNHRQEAVVSEDQPDPFWEIDRGFGGYSIEALGLETPLQRIYHPLPAQKKIEENRPVALLTTGDETLMLQYDPTASSPKTPSSDKKTLYRFQPKTVYLPFKIQLIRAEKEYYPNSLIAASYRAKITIPAISKQIIDLSMNQVYEAPSGHRFYLSHLIEGNRHRPHSIQLAVNYDPAKYFLTYPGALLLVIGSSLLFFRRN